MTADELIQYICDSEDYLNASQIMELCEKNQITGSDRTHVFEETFDDILSHNAAIEFREHVIDNYAEYATGYDKNSQNDRNWLHECMTTQEPDYDRIVVFSNNRYHDIFDFVEQKLIQSGIA